MPPAPTDSLSANIAPIAAGAHVTAACFLGDVPALILAFGLQALGVLLPGGILLELATSWIG